MMMTQQRNQTRIGLKPSMIAMLCQQEQLSLPRKTGSGTIDWQKRI
jgi:hypothetical protein